MVDGRQSAAHLLGPLQYRQLVAGGKCVTVAADQIVDRSVDDVKRRRQRLAIYTHTAKLSEPTDKER